MSSPINVQAYLEALQNPPTKTLRCLTDNAAAALFFGAAFEEVLGRFKEGLTQVVSIYNQDILTLAKAVRGVQQVEVLRILKLAELTNFSKIYDKMNLGAMVPEARDLFHHYHAEEVLSTPSSLFPESALLSMQRLKVNPKNIGLLITGRASVMESGVPFLIEQANSAFSEAIQSLLQAETEVENRWRIAMGADLYPPVDLLAARTTFKMVQLTDWAVKYLRAIVYDNREISEDVRNWAEEALREIEYLQ